MPKSIFKRCFTTLRDSSTIMTPVFPKITTGLFLTHSHYKSCQLITTNYIRNLLILHPRAWTLQKSFFLVSLYVADVIINFCPFDRIQTTSITKLRVHYKQITPSQCLQIVVVEIRRDSLSIVGSPVSAGLEVFRLIRGRLKRDLA